MRTLSGLLLTLLILVSCQIPSSDTRGHTVRGTVTDLTGTPVGGVTVRDLVSGRQAVSAADGSYALTGLPGVGVSLEASASGLVLVARYAPGLGEGGPTLVFSATAVTGADFLAVAPGDLTVSLVQGRGSRSPLEGRRVDGIRGVVTLVTRKAPHALYEQVEYDGTSVPQWISEDGFFLEAQGTDRGGDPAASDGIFVSTHDGDYTESKWLPGIPTDLVPGDLVTVSGTVTEERPVNRFGESAGYLTRTTLRAASVVPRTDGAGNRLKTAVPDGVVLTYDAAAAGASEFRTLPWQEAGLPALGRAVAVLESVEGMVVRVNQPVVTSSTYYNLTGILADGGRRQGTDNADLNAVWKSVVLNKDDFNTELLFTDGQKPDWKTFEPIPQVGDALVDTAGDPVLRGVMDYTADPVYLIRPLPTQGWGFTTGRTWYPPSIQALFRPRTTAPLTISSAERTTIAAWRIGPGADARFRVPWAAAEADRLTVATFNLENYVNQGKPYAKDADVAKVILGNLKAPDIVVVEEMGDDNATVPVYVNQDNSYAIPDGVVSAVRNFRGLVDALQAQGGPTYDFRQIDPLENQDGGAPGNNIRVGFLFRTDRVAFTDRGLPTNSYAATAGDPDTWPVPSPSPRSELLAGLETQVAADAGGRPYLTQSPGRLQDSSFRSSRKPLAGEFVFKPSGTTVFVVGAHLGSKGGDGPLYGAVQPPFLGSEANRSRQGEKIRGFVSRILAWDPGARVVVAGDLNDFPFSRPLAVLSGDSTGSPVLFSPTARFMPPTEQFSYAFRGNLQQLDHIFVSRSLYEAVRTEGTSDWKTVCFIPHIDSVFSKNNHIQTSDHDPVAVRLGGFP